jgi:nitrite reductase/ring-hydroxylating ferredoxin subunit
MSDFAPPSPIKVRKLVPAGPADLPIGGRRIVKLETYSIGVFRIESGYYGIVNYCPHEGAELCKGRLTGTNMPTDKISNYEWGCEGRILRCPWHKWEFDLITGQHVADPSFRARTYRVIESDGNLHIEL